MSACYHCWDGTCDCISCGKEAPSGWTSGKCVACAGAALWDRVRDMVPDPREHQHWHLKKEITGGFKRVFTPLEVLLK